MTTPQLREIALDRIRPSGTNPRKDFDSASAKAYLADLAETIRVHGVVQAALVRPEYCVGRRTRAEIDSVRSVFDGDVGNVVLIAGECRWRASQLAKRATLPCVVREMTDDDAREVQQIENLQRKDLSPIEEAQGFDEMLNLRDEMGKPRYTVASLADRIGCSIPAIFRSRALLKLPANAKAAVTAGLISKQVACLISAVPAPEAREQFARRVLQPELSLEPLTFSEAKRVRDEYFVQKLGGAPFALKDAALLPDAGACELCPKMAANVPHLFDGEQNDAKQHRQICLDPSCYRKKLSALFKRQAVVAEKEGKRLLTEEENEKVFPPLFVDGMMAPTSPYVEMSKRPAEHLLKREVANAPAWRQLVEEAERKTGGKVARLLARDQGHVLREIVDVKAAMALIEKSGEPIFRDTGDRSTANAAAAEERLGKKAERAEAKQREAAAIESLSALHAALQKGWAKAAVLDVLFDLSLAHAGPDGVGLVAKWQKLPDGGGAFAMIDAVNKWANTLTMQERHDMIPLLLLSADMKVNGTASAAFQRMADALEVDVKAIEKTARGVTKAKAAAKPAKLSREQLEVRVREMRREKKGETEIYLALQMPRRSLRKLLKQIDAEETAAKVTMDPKKLSEWVKARADVMSDEEIARSYKVPVADVAGALGKGDVKRAKAGKKGGAS